MSLNKNSLVYLCLDKLMDMTENIAANPSEATLHWVSTTWSSIHKLPLLYRSYCYHLFTNLNLKIRVALSTQAPYLWISYYVKDRNIFLGLGQDEFLKIINNKDQKNHLNNRVTLLEMTLCKFEESPPNSVQLKKFLFYCTAVKIIKMDHKNEYISHAKLLLDCFTVCPNIEMLENFRSDDRKAFFNFILGIKYSEMKKPKKILENNKPSWLKLKCIDTDIGNDDSDDLDDCVHNLCFLILKDFQNAFPKFPEHDEMSQRVLMPLLKTRIGKSVIPSIGNIFQRIQIDYCEHFFITELHKRKVMVNIMLGERKLKNYLKIFEKLYCKVPENQVNFCLTDSTETTTLPNHYKDHVELIRTKYSFILKFALICTLNCQRHFGLDKLRELTKVVSEAPSLEILEFSISCIFDIDISKLPVCLAHLPCIIIKTDCQYCHQYIECFIKIFPNVGNIVLDVDECTDVKEIDVESNFEYIEHMKNLKSFYVNFENHLFPNWLHFLFFISDRINKNVKLFFSVPQHYLSTHILSNLKNHGWHLYIK